jgi:hypothetical protein
MVVSIEITKIEMNFEVELIRSRDVSSHGPSALSQNIGRADCLILRNR